MWDTVSVNTLQNFSPPNPPPRILEGFVPSGLGGGEGDMGPWGWGPKCLDSVQHSQK
jgi:hypothetical protein